MSVGTEVVAQGSNSNRPIPLNSLVASATRITSATVKDRRGYGKPEAWQDDAWEMFDLVGEQRFLATTLAGRLSQARLYVGRVPDDPTEAPEPLENDEDLAARVFDKFGGTPQSRSQMILRMGINLWIAGDGWLVGVPKHLMPKDHGGTGTEGAPAQPEIVAGRPSDTRLDDILWHMLSVSEVSFLADTVKLKFGETEKDTATVNPDDVFLIRVWRPHPRRSWQADSPTRSSLPVLRELVGLTMHVSAQVDSRLAGAGILVVPASARRAMAIAAGLDPDSEEDPFTEALIKAMLTPINDRSNASALVPLVIVVPDETTGLFQHIKFSAPLDAEARALRDEAIRRLALGEDAPPELLLGTGGMNHWGAWLVREDVVTSHLEPPLALMCDAITTQFLWPVLIEQGMDEVEAQNFVVWYDVSHMVQRPNRLADASALFDKGVIKDETLREAGGFTEEDAPAALSKSVELAVQMAVANPALVDNLKEIIAAFDEVLNPTPAEVVDLKTAEPPPEGEDIIKVEQGPPDTQDNPPPSEALVASVTDDRRSIMDAIARMTSAEQEELLASFATQLGIDADTLREWFGSRSVPNHAYLPGRTPAPHRAGHG